MSFITSPKPFRYDTLVEVLRDSRLFGELGEVLGGRSERRLRPRRATILDQALKETAAAVTNEEDEVGGGGDVTTAADAIVVAAEEGMSAVPEGDIRRKPTAALKLPPLA